MKKIWIGGVVVIAAIVGAQTTQQFTTYQFLGTGGTQPRTMPDRINDLVNIREYGATGNGSTDDTAAIQAAIDYAYNNHKQSIFCPAGTYKTSTSLYLDKPNNLRGSAATWASGTTYAINATVTFAGVPWISLANSNVGHTPSVTSTFWAQTTATISTSAFSLTFIGEPGAGANHEGWGCQIKPTFNNGVAFWVGPGRGMGVKNVQILGPGGGYRGNQNSAGAGIAVSNFTSGTKIENTWVENFYQCYSTSYNGDNLADSNSFVKLQADNCYLGINISQTQNDINDIIEPTITATIAIQSNVARPVAVVGGNLSSPSSAAAQFTISSVSAPTGVSCTNTCVTQFTATISSPDSNITSCGTNVGNCIYNSWVIVLPDFGPVPLKMSAYNSGTNVGTFQVHQPWSDFYFWTGGAYNSSRFSTELQAATTIQAIERLTTFYGRTFNVNTMHIENPNACTTFLLSYSGFGGPSTSRFEHIFFNYDPGGSGLQSAAAGTADYARYQCQQSFPFIELTSTGGSFTLDAFDAGQDKNSTPVIIDIDDNGTQKTDFFVGTNTLFNPAIRNTRTTSSATWITAKSSSSSDYQYLYPDTLAIGAGHWAQNPFQPAMSGTSPKQFLGTYLQGQYHGWFPDPTTMPRLTPTLVTVLGGTLPTDKEHYYPAFGNVIYQVSDWNSGATTNHFAKFAHQFASWGQSLSVNWSYVGGTTMLKVSGTDYVWLFPGLQITINNGGGNVDYLVTGVYPLTSTTAQLSVLNLSGGESTWNLLAGTVGTTYTGSTITQAAYTIAQF